MKKILIISTLITFVCVNSSIAATNMPSAPGYYKPASKTGGNSSSYYRKDYKPKAAPTNITPPAVNTPKSSSGSVKSELDQLAMSILKAAEKRDNSKMQTYVQQLMEKGATGMCQPQIISKRTPTCPPIKLELNGRQLSGSMCAMTCYEYEGKQYDVGYCK